MRLHTADGARKYLTAGERNAFLREADLADRQVRTLCMTLAYAGCRLSEALALTADRVDLAADVLTIESLKKRRTGIYRTVPVPSALLDALDMVHGICSEPQSSAARIAIGRPPTIIARAGRMRAALPKSRPGAAVSPESARPEAARAADCRKCLRPPDCRSAACGGS